MHVAASMLSCARKPRTFGDDERNSGDGEAVGVEAAAAVMGAAPSGVDRAERARVPERLSRMSASRSSSRSASCSTSSSDEWRSGVNERDGEETNVGPAADGEETGVDPAAAVMGAAPVDADCSLVTFSARLTTASLAARSIIIRRHGVQAPAAKTHPLFQSSSHLELPSIEPPKVEAASCSSQEHLDCPLI